MLVVAVPAPVLATNCYVVAVSSDGPGVVIDPGIGVDEALATVLREHRITPEAVLITHGHVDHVYDAARVPGAPPVHIHRDDAHRLADPLSDLPAPMVAALQAQLGAGARWDPPSTVVPARDGDVLRLAGLDFRVRHAPGHTQGSSLYLIDGVPDGTAPPTDRTAFTGDVLFAGTIGRTDLAGGDHATMLRTLATVVLDLPDDTLVLPGHGPGTTMRRERATNPFLQDLTTKDA